ncbi:MAG: chemotaxis protein CheA [Syntrophales bacterium]|nr:chemotaxis protein CheA [Syntrophales bacterium]MDD5231888.1 chemotaxis protein CheA [Syntrophales bacterium]MDD5533341.1 chemotaxis protein CheA [Syntrophales bacterium]
MDTDSLMNELDELATGLLILDSRTVDVMTAGKFLNDLEQIIRSAGALNLSPLQDAARELYRMLERVVIDYDDIKDHEAVFSRLEKGIGRMQEIARTFRKTGEIPAAEAGPETDPQAGGEAPQVKAGPYPAEGEIVMQDESLVKDFIVESLEYINEIEVNILNLEQNPEDKDFINAIFRPFHSIKGVAGFLNLEKIRDLAHSLENALDRVRNDEWPVTTQLIDIILDGADSLKGMIGNLKSRMEGSGEEVNVDVTDLMKRLKLMEEDPSKYSAAPAKVKKIGEILVDEGVVEPEALEKVLEDASRKDPPKRVGEALIEEGKATPKQVSQALRKQATQVSDAASIRVDTRKLDDLVNMVGELVITQSMIRQSPSVQSNTERKLFRDVSQMTTITSELQRISMSLRMIPIKQTFQRMSRLVRDLSKTAGKQVNIELVGEDTEIDRNMVEEIYNPLVHLIRNSVDHGIEPPKDRAAAGKPEAGLIKLKAYHRGGHIVIEIFDDGRGLNREKIADKAVKNGLIESKEGMSDQDVYRLIFMPGLSTAEKVTDVSGRGVGMDVVKQAVDKLRGKIEVESVPGRGTTFVTSFPLTMAIIDGMIVRVGQERYIIPTTAIRQLLRPNQESFNSVIGKGEVVSIRGKLLPLVRLYDLFDIDPERRNPWEAIVVVVDGETRSKCLLVDEIIGKEEVVIKGLGDSLKTVKGVSGGAIMGDGSVGLILDPEGLFELSESRSRTAPAM